MTKAVQCTWVY